jgi:hypothetical protein
LPDCAKLEYPKNERSSPPCRDLGGRYRGLLTIGADEGGSQSDPAELIDPTIAAHNGRLVKTTGDGLLVEFGSVVDAVQGR